MTGTGNAIMKTEDFEYRDGDHDRADRHFFTLDIEPLERNIMARRTRNDLVPDTADLDRHAVFLSGPARVIIAVDPVRLIQVGEGEDLPVPIDDLNADLAVIRWKKYLGFYADLEGEHFAAYTLDGNAMANEDKK